METSKIVPTYSPLVLTYRDKWALDFQFFPEPKIIFSGEAPTRDELIQCLGIIGAPVYMIPVIEIIIHSELGKRAKGEGV